MLYLNEKSINDVGINWDKTVDVIEESVDILSKGDFSQPVKPYLRFGDPKNRIIAMPAYIGQNIDIAGIKWIASFPGNINKGIARANSVTVLNSSETGIPVSIINTPLISIIRTASVSGFIIREYLKCRKEKKTFNVGITGWGPIGKQHYDMVKNILKDRLGKVSVYDIRPVDVVSLEDEITNVDTWQEAYQDADIFITCTVSDAPYIDKKPKDGSLQLNVSLRDYKQDILEWVNGAVIVDDWEEVCRENTDIEVYHLNCGLNKSDTHSIEDVLTKKIMSSYPKDKAIMFNPMGMAIFDTAIAGYYYKTALAANIGQKLN